MSEKQYPFLHDEELRQGNGSTRRVQAWQRAANEYEKQPVQGYVYPAARVESLGIGEPKLERYHNESFVIWLENYLTSHPQTVAAVLDIGGGAGLYAEQLRNIFGDSVTVFTTGLSKKSANTLREHINHKNSFFSYQSEIDVKDKIHPNDLKWRSVLQLSDFPEFDLMVDTVGEFSYLSDNESEIKRYFLAIIHKLRVGGHASIVVGSNLELESAVLELDEIKGNPKYSQVFEYHVEYTDLPTGLKKDEMHSVLKIDKKTNLDV